MAKFLMVKVIVTLIPTAYMAFSDNYFVSLIPAAYMSISEKYVV